MYFYLAIVGFEPTPTSTAAPSNTETTVIPSRPLRSLKRSYHGRGLCLISLHYTSDRVTRFRCANTIIYIQGIPGSYGYRSLEIIYYIKDIQAPTDIPPRIISDASTSEKLYNVEIKMYFYLAIVGFEPTPTSTAAPSNTETTVIPTRRGLNYLGVLE